MASAFIQILKRDLRLAFRRWNELATPLIFFAIIASLFPLAASPDEAQLRTTGSAVLWMSALLASLLALDGLFRADAEDGSMEQLILSPAPLGLVVAAKIVAHWAVSGVPLLILAPLLALSYYLPLTAVPALIGALALATPTLSVLAAIGAALTVSLRAGGTIIGLLVLPLTGPVLIFGTRATELAAQGEPVAGPLYLLAALAVLAISLGPLIAAAAVRTAAGMNTVPLRSRLWRWFHQLASPPYMYRLAGRAAPWLAGSACILLTVGAYGGLVLSPPDYLQGDAFRIIYVHVPSAYISMFAYVVMAGAAAIGYIWRIKLAHGLAVSVAPLGAWFTALALITGGIWGRPTWGTYWEWGDARLMFELLLLFLYIGYMVLRMSFDDREKADRVSALLAVVGVVNVPIVHYSVQWWTTLHQGPTLIRPGGPSITLDMLVPLLIMIAGFTLFFAWLLCKRVQGEILRRQNRARWVRRLATEGAA